MGGVAQPGIDETPPARRGLLALFVGVFLLCCAVSLALPHDRYIRYQQLAGTPLSPGVWIYERLHYDRTPIDIAIIGASRTEIGISAPQMERALTARFGHPVHVANLSLAQDGRDLHYEITRELIATHPEVKLILYSLTEHSARTGHRAFRNLADTGEVLGAPLLVNPSYFNNVVYLPYRQVSLFLQTTLPAMFGVRTAFDPKTYWGTDHDTTVSHWGSNGKWVERDAVRPAAALGAQVDSKVASRTPVLLPAGFRDYEYVLERTYTRRIADLAQRHGIAIGFVYLPIYGHHFVITDRAFYHARGFIMDAGALADDHRDFSDYAHFNQIGTTRATRWVAERLAALDNDGALHFTPRSTAH
jgi:hypothetical protein